MPPPGHAGWTRRGWARGNDSKRAAPSPCSECSSRKGEGHRHNAGTCAHAPPARRHHAITPPRHHAITPSRHHAITPSRHHAGTRFSGIRPATASTTRLRPCRLA
ncbi:MAG: hypothetical protein EOO29_03050 [Comamonadaceae bacterium]|nr:MAG: hypothetical protein EOO29_03050 [Comamonadaceae bacterium]